MHTRKELIKGRFATVRWWLDLILVRLTPEMMDWAPAPGMRTIAGQLVEIAAVEAPLVSRLTDGRQLTDPEVDAIIGDQHSLENLRRALVEVRRGTLEYLESLSEYELSEEVKCDQWFGTFHRPLLPRAEHFLNISEHEFYHVGQLVSYLWSRGEDPDTWF